MVYLLKNLRGFYKYCEREEYVSNNPCKRVSWQKEPKVIINSFTNSEVIKMLEAYNYSNYYNARFRIYQGMKHSTGNISVKYISIEKDMLEAIKLGEV